MTRNPRPRTFLLSILATHVGTAFTTLAIAATPKYKLTEIVSPTFPSQSTFCVDVNDSGVALVGVQDRGWLTWRNENVLHEELSFDANPVRINNRGEVAGVKIPNSSLVQGFLITDTGTEITLQDLPGGQVLSSPHGLNSLGQVFGDSVGDVGNNASKSLPVRWHRDGSVETLGTMLPPGDRLQVFDANDAGAVVGETTELLLVAPFRRTTAWIWQESAFQDLPMNHASAINNAGEVVGSIYDGPNAGGVIWSGGEASALEPLANGATSLPLDVNDGGVSAGVGILGGSFYAATWTHDGVATMLSDVTTNAQGWRLEQATAINNQGVIVGWGVSPRGKTRGFVLTPLVPEPQTLALALLLLASMLVSRLTTRAEPPKTRLKTGG